jgi:uncharacterized protein YxeA
MKKCSGIMVAILLTCILAAAVAVVYFSSDRKGPTITIDTSKVKPYSKEQGQDVLKSYATAVDAKDGDVSSSIIIENVYVMDDLSKAKVIYVARDKSSNITKYNYVIDYVPSQDEIAQSEGTTQPETTTAVAQTTVAGKTEVTTERATTTQTATTQAATTVGGPLLKMSATEATVSTGAAFNVSKYITDITDDKDTKDTLSRRVIVGGTYSTSVAGEYTLDVYCTDTDRNESNHVTFTLHVK